MGPRPRGLYDVSMSHHDTHVTQAQLEKTLEKAFDAFFMRMDARIDAKLDVFAVRMEDMMDRKIEALAIMTQRGFVEMREYVDARFDALEVRVGNLESQMAMFGLSSGR